MRASSSCCTAARAPARSPSCSAMRPTSRSPSATSSTLRPCAFELGHARVGDGDADLLLEHDGPPADDEALARRRERRHAEARVDRGVAHVVRRARPACARRAGWPPRTGASTPSPPRPRATGRARPRRPRPLRAPRHRSARRRRSRARPSSTVPRALSTAMFARPGALEGARVLVRDAARRGPRGARARSGARRATRAPWPRTPSPRPTWRPGPRRACAFAAIAARPTSARGDRYAALDGVAQAARAWAPRRRCAPRRPRGA